MEFPSQFVYHFTLIHLFIFLFASGNRLGQSGVKRITHAIHRNRSLQYFDLLGEVLLFSPLVSFHHFELGSQETILKVNKQSTNQNPLITRVSHNDRRTRRPQLSSFFYFRV